MPIYEYVCSACNAKFEEMRPLSQSGQDAECPKCHKTSHRKMSTFAAFTTSVSGVPQRVSGTNSSSCSGCSSGSCSTCAS